MLVPNHMLEQFSRGWLQLHPAARILVADKERLSKNRRKEFVARAAAGDWDGIVFTQSGFSHIPLGQDLMREYMAGGRETARAELAGSKDGKGLSVKKLEGRIAQLEEKYKRLLAEHTKDDGVRFEEIGIDLLFVDEAHATRTDGSTPASTCRHHWLPTCPGPRCGPDTPTSAPVQPSVPGAARLLRGHLRPMIGPTSTPYLVCGPWVRLWVWVAR